MDLFFLSTPLVCNGGDDFALRGHIRQRVETFLVFITVWGLATGIWCAEALDAVQDFPVPTVSSAKVEKPWIREI